eukprot:CAMPEP_0181437830 /NCGR_PEP_ID=MMETSP1110-20121109/21588_1 /TAXON_ID=174948 /ORGANISM="Symbiodinium sp., Strain CCMP421" /LENGTH=192 /DNA_ID=CAMNT_0023561483 /DNA_START=76 /DNA_END=651 /DNA_ORIENTATION=+
MGCNNSKKAAPPQVKKEEKKAEPVAPKETPKEEPKKEEGGIAETVADAAESVMDGLKALVGYGEEEKGDVVDVSKGMQVTNIRRQQSGKVVQHTATDVLVKYDDGKTEWAEIEDLKKLEAAAVGEDKGSPDVRVEGAGDTKAIALADGSEPLPWRWAELLGVRMMLLADRPAHGPKLQGLEQNLFLLPFDRG